MTRAYETASVAVVPLSEIRISPTQPRRQLDKKALEELATSIQGSGLLQPILVRAQVTKDGEEFFEIVCGHRRYEAFKLLGADNIKAIIVDMTNSEAATAQLVENAERIDVHPMDEALAYKRLLEEFKLTVHEIAQRVGKSTSLIYQRLSLCDLCDRAQKLFLANRLTLGAAVLLSTVGQKKQQEQILKKFDYFLEMKTNAIDKSAMTTAVTENTMRELTQATFKMEDDTLGKPMCIGCLKRTSCSPALFKEFVGDADFCMDLSCFNAKTEAVFNARVKQAEDKGWRVFHGEAASKILPYDSYCTDRTYISAEDYAQGSRTWRSFLGKNLEPLVGAIVFKARANIMLIKRAQLITWLEEHGHKDIISALKRGNTALTPQEREKRKEAAIEKKVTKATDTAAIMALVDAAEGATNYADNPIMMMMAERYLDRILSDDLKLIMKRREFEPKSKYPMSRGGETAGMVQELLTDKLTRLGMVIELILTDCYAHSSYGNMAQKHEGRMKEIAKLLGVDLAKIKRETKASIVKPQAKTAKPAAKPKPKKKAARR